jgi:hypothetical protein
MISSGANSSQAEMYNLGRSSSLFRCSFEFAFCIDYEEPEDTKGVIRSIQETGSVPITTNVVSSNPDHVDVYSL